MGLFGKKEDKTSDFDYLDKHPIEMIKNIWPSEKSETTFALANKIKSSNIANDVDLLFDIKRVLDTFQKLTDRDGGISLLLSSDPACWITCREADIYACGAVVANAVYENLFGQEIADKLSSVGCFSTAYVLSLWSIDDALRENDPFKAIVKNPKLINGFFNGDKDNALFYFLYNNGYAMNQDIIDLDYINSNDSIIWNREVFKKKDSNKIVEYDIMLTNNKEVREKVLYKEDGSIRELDTIEYYLSKEKPELLIKD